MSQVLKTTGLEATGAAKAFQGLSFGLLGSAGVVTAFGLVVYKTASMVNNAAKEIKNMADQFKRMGVNSYAEGKNIVEQYEKFGMTVEQAMQNIQAGINANIEARRKGASQVFDELRQEFGPEFIEQYRQAVGKIGRASCRERVCLYV